MHARLEVCEHEGMIAMIHDLHTSAGTGRIGLSPPTRDGSLVRRALHLQLGQQVRGPLETEVGAVDPDEVSWNE